MIGRLHWISKVTTASALQINNNHYTTVHVLQDKLAEFILASQDEETGGFSDRPGDEVGPY